ncbi:NosD domain-containing protein [Methanofollis fontis]|uniref:PKD domain-containing protein n=1 Tax=Methanofollis fontis TaxID=2052832 RepID=A0A483CNB1_9EURY|nr:NosD domain-containing protein [Methanofollis fontis]TAJ44552.1 hypothetical protein CUJ86_04350 [Methanofollis fontis]
MTTRSSRTDGRFMRWIAATFLLLLLFSIAPASADPLEQTRHVFVEVSNADGVKYDLDGAAFVGPNNTYYIKADGGGLNELHITADAADAQGQVTTSSDQSGVFYVSNTGGRGFDDEIVLLLAVNGTVPDDFAVHIKTSGYTWTPSAVTNQIPTNYTYVEGAVDETFTKEDFLYGPQTWKPGPGNPEPYLPPGLPLYEYQDVADTSDNFSLMFIDLDVGNMYPSKFGTSLTDNGAAKVEYSFENLETFASFNAYGWCLAANQGQGISWTNRVNAAGETAVGASSYAVIGIPPVLTSIAVTPASVDAEIGDSIQFTATAYDGDDEVMSDISFAWSSSDETVGTVNATGYFNALTAGTTTLTAANGMVEGTAEVTVTAAPSGPQPLPDYNNVFFKVANDGGVKYNAFGNNTYNFRFEGYDRGLNALHISTDPVSNFGQVTLSENQSGTFFATDSGGKGYEDDIILMVAVNGTISDNFMLHITADGYTWTPNPVSNQAPPLDTVTYQPFTLNETFTKDDFRYGPQIWKPTGNGFDYPIYFGQNMSDAENTFQIMFIDLNAGVLRPNADLENRGAVRINYTFENLETFAAFNVYAYCQNSNNGDDMIAWTNAVLAPKTTSGYSVIGAGTGPVPSRIEVEPTITEIVVGDVQQFTATAYDALNNVISGLIFSWMSSDETVGIIDENGNFTALAAGTTNVTANHLGIAGTSAITVVSPEPRTWTIGASGCDFTDLDSAFVSPSLNDGDTILVSAGSYALSTPLAKTITLTGEGADVVTVTPTGAAFSGAGTVIEGIGFTSGSFSVSGAESTVAHCTFTGFSSQHSIAISGQNVAVEGNVFENNPTRFMLVTGSGHTFTNNTFEANGGTQNAATRFDGCSGVTIARNTFANNTAPAIGLRCTLDNNSIFLNDFIDNKADLFQFLNNPKPLAMAWEISSIDYTYLGTQYTGPLGNYHSSYTGDDADGNGVIDAAYTIGTNQVDNAPLVNRWQTYFPDAPAPKTVTVGASGCDFTDLDSAFASPSLNDGDTILVSAGSYALSTPLAKTVTLTGEGADVVTVTPTGAAFSGAGTVIEGIGFTSGSFSVSGAESTVAHCTFTGFSSQHSIAISGQNVAVEGNVFENNPTRFMLVTGSGHTFTNNTFEANGGTQNAATRFDGCSGVTIARNTFANNTAPAIGLRCTLDDNQVFLNDFIDNKADLFQFLNNPKPLAMAWEISSIDYTYLGTQYTGPLGNYHSSYTGDDADGNGVIDAAYTIGTNQVDNAPLVNRWQTYFSGTGPEPDAPTAAFTADVTSGDAPLSVQFTDLSTGSPISWTWDFENDGIVDSTEQNPAHVYTAVGTYTVNLTVTNAVGSDSEVKTDYITVHPDGPVTLYVDASGGGDFTTIQAAVNATFDGDTIVVRDGTYAENIAIDRTLTIRSENGPENTVVTAADPAAAVISITVDHVVLSGLSVMGTPEGSEGLATSGIYLNYADNCTIEENAISKTGRGVYVYRGDNNTITRNTMTRNDYAVYLNGYGSSSTSPHLAHNNTVTYNTVTGNNAGSNLAALRIYAVDDTIVANNTVTNNGGYGMILNRADEADVAYNNISSNGDAGIYLWYSNYHTTIRENIVSANAAGFKITKGGGTSDIYLNDITGNAVPVLDDNGHAQNWQSPEEITYLYNSQRYTSLVGNYWGSNYTGTDADGNGIGDEAYTIAGEITDAYPLIQTLDAYTVYGPVPVGTTYYVDDDGTADFTTIQAALDAASDGDTIIVRDGTYNETLTIAKSLTLRSENGPETTNVVSTEKYAVSISANNTMVSGFSLSGSGSYGIYSRSNSMCTFANNVITDKKIGIDVLFVSGMRIDGNIITDLQTYGSCIILQNTIDSVISNNTCSGGGQRGIYTTTDCSNNVITGNFISGNQYGFLLMGCKNSRFDRNIVMDNEYAFFMTFDSVTGNTFFANSFVNDSALFATSLKVANTWNSPEPVTYTYNGATYTGMIGNYWGAGFPIDDVDGNGIGDTGVSLFTDNTDSYPLVLPAEAYFGEPYGDIPVPATVEIVPSSVVLPGETTQQFSGTVYDQNGNVMTGASFRWTSSDERVGPISSGGLFSAEYAGTTTITGQSYLVRGTAEAVVNKTVLETVWTDPCESTDGWTLFNTALQDGVVYKGSYSIGTPAIAGDAYAERSIDFPDGVAQFRFRAYQDSATNGVGTYSWLKAFIDNETVETLPVGQFKGPWNTYTINITGYETGNHTFRIESHFDPGTYSGRAIGFYVDQLEVRIDPSAVTADISSITVEPTSATLTHGETQAFVATAYDADNNTVPGVSFTWTSSDATVGTVDASGIFTARKVGTTTVRAAVGEVFGTAAVTVTPPHGDQTEDSPLNVPGCNITDNGNGTRQVLVNTTAVNATVSGNTIRIEEDTFSLILETEGAPSVGNGTVNGTVAGITLNTTPVTTLFDTLGTVTASLEANLTGIPAGAAVQTTVSANVSADAMSAFQLAATADGLNLDAVAYTLNIVKTNLTNGQDISDATIRMAVSQAWVDSHGGVDAVAIIRSAEDGTKEVLATTYIGLDADGNLIFEGYSPNGLSVFGLAAASASTTPSGSSSSSGGSSNVASFAGSVPAGATRTFTVTQTAVKQIGVTAKDDIGDLLITVKAVSLPSEIEAPVQATYQIQEIALYRADTAAIGSAAIEFAVPTSWLDARGLTTDDIVLLRYVDGAWTTLPTTFVEEKNGFAYYSAETPGFSYFAIAVEKSVQAEAGEPAAETTTAAVSMTTSATGTTAAATTPQPSPLPWFVAVVAIGALFLLRKH